MVDFTPEELEKYRQWVESFKDSSIEPPLDAQREEIALAEELARSQKSAAKPLSTLGESLSGIGELKSKLPSGIPSPAQESAKVFEEAGGALPKNVAEDIVKAVSRPGKSAEEAAEVLAPKELPALREEKGLVKSPGTRLAEVLPEETGLVKASDAAKDVIDVTPKSPSLLSRLTRGLRIGGGALGAASTVYDLSKGDVVNAGLDATQGLGFLAGRAVPILELFRTTDAGQGSDIVPGRDDRGVSLAQTKSPSAGMGDLRVSDAAALQEQLLKLSKDETKKPEISKAVAAPSSSDAVSSALIRAIEAESKKEVKPEVDYMAELEQAKKQRDAIRLLSMLGRAGETISTGITGVVPGGVVTKPASGDFYANLLKLAESPIEDFGTKYTLAGKEEERKRLQARRDPASEESKFARELLKSQGITVPETATAESLEKYSSQLTNILNQREAQKTRELLLKERSAERQEKDTEKAEEKKLTTALRLAPKVQNKQYETYSELRTQASLMKNALKNPSPTGDVATIYSFIKALDPKSAVREGEIDFVQLAKSVPTTIVQYFKRAFSGKILPDEARREMVDYISQREQQSFKEWELSASPYLKQASKAGIDRELVAPGTTELQDEKDPKIQEYATKHSLSYEKAESILRARGYGK